ncbi:chaplin family protein [Streptomyces sp. NPDC055189]
MKSLYLALPACFAAGVGLIGASCAQADSGAQGAAQGSPGAVSGNLAQLPLHVPANVCGNTVNVVGLLNPAFGNRCANADAHSRGSFGDKGQAGQQGTPPQGSAAQPQHPSGYGDEGPAQETGRRPVQHPGDGAGKPQHPGDGAGKPQRPGDDAGKPQQHGSPQASHASSPTAPADGGAHRDQLSREQGPEAGHPVTGSARDGRQAGLTPVASGHGAGLEGSAGPSSAGDAAVPGAPALAETGAEDGLGLAALAAAGITGAGVVMTRRARSSRR